MIPDVCKTVFESAIGDVSSDRGCKAAKSCTATFDRQLQLADRSLKQSVGLAQLLDQIDRDRAAQPYKLTQDLDYFVRKQVGLTSAQPCWSVLDSLKSQYFRPDRTQATSSYPVFQRLSDAVSYLMTDLTARLAESSKTIENLSTASDKIAEVDQLRDIGSRYMGAAKVGDLEALLDLDPKLKAATEAVRQHVAKLNAQTAQLDDLQDALSAARADATNPELAPFLESTMPTRVEELSTQVVSLLKVPPSTRGDAAVQLSKIESERDTIAAKVDLARQQSHRADELRAKVRSELAKARATFSSIEVSALDDAGKQRLKDRITDVVDSLDRLSILSAKPLLEATSDTERLSTAAADIALQFERDKAVAKSKQLLNHDQLTAGGVPSGSNDAAPYNDSELLVYEMVASITNPLKAREFEARLRRKGVARMGIYAAEIAQDGDAWLVHLTAQGGTLVDHNQGLFCRVAGDDGDSLLVLQNVSFSNPIITVTGQVGEYQVNPPAILRIVFDPCSVGPAPH